MKLQNPLDKGKILKAYHICVILSVMSDSLQPYGTVAHQASLPMGFSRQEYWSRLPFPPPGSLPDPGIKPESAAWQVDFLPLGHLGST